MIKKDVIIALDFESRERALEFLDKFKGKKPFLKVGMELFYSAGPEFIRELKERGHKIFLDLKLHDIPNTVKKTMRVLSNLDIDMVNLHASGTKEMMKAALEGLTVKGKKRPLLIAVTMLTSTSQERMENDLLIKENLPDVVLHYAKNAKKCGLDGIVCSPLESEIVHEKLGDDFLTVTPGVRFSDGDVGDQVRVTTPKRASELGSNFIVVGRPITQSDDPVMAYERALKEFLGEV